MEVRCENCNHTYESSLGLCPYCGCTQEEAAEVVAEIEKAKAEVAKEVVPQSSTGSKKSILRLIIGVSAMTLMTVVILVTVFVLPIDNSQGLNGRHETTSSSEKDIPEQQEGSKLGETRPNKPEKYEPKPSDTVPSETMPDVLGKGIDEVTTTLENLGIAVTIEYEFDDSIKRGEVISSSIKAGDVVPESAEIVIKVSDGPESKFTGALNDAVMRAILFIHTLGDSQNEDFSKWTTVANYDADADGDSEWLLYDESEQLTIIDGDFGGYSIHSLSVSNTASSIYENKSNGGLVFNCSRGSAGYMFEENMVYTGNRFEQLSYMYTEFDWDKDDFNETEFKVREQTANEQQYNSINNTVIGENRISIFSAPDGYYTWPTDLSNRLISVAAEKIKSLPFITSSYIGDINGDGEADAAFILGVYRELELKGVDYTDSEVLGMNRLTRSGLVLLSSDEGIQGQVLYAYDTEKMIERTKASQTVAELINGNIEAIKDGEYLLRVYEDLLIDAPEGTYAYCDNLHCITFSDEYVRSLRVGDEIDLSAYSAGKVAVSSIQFGMWGDTPTFDFGDDEFYMSYDGEVWKLRGLSDVFIEYSTGKVLILFTGESKIYDGLNYFEQDENFRPAHRVNSIKELMEHTEFYRSTDSNYELMFSWYYDINITIKNGVVENAWLYFTP